VLTLTKLQYSLYEYFNNLHAPLDKTAVNRYVGCMYITFI